MQTAPTSTARTDPEPEATGQAPAESAQAPTERAKLHRERAATLVTVEPADPARLAYDCRRRPRWHSPRWSAPRWSSPPEPRAGIQLEPGEQVTHGPAAQDRVALPRVARPGSSNGGRRASGHQQPAPGRGRSREEGRKRRAARGHPARARTDGSRGRHRRRGRTRRSPSKIGPLGDRLGSRLAAAIQRAGGSRRGDRGGLSVAERSTSRLRARRCADPVGDR
jgi:hypothetical protein